MSGAEWKIWQKREFWVMFYFYLFQWHREHCVSVVELSILNFTFGELVDMTTQVLVCYFIVKVSVFNYILKRKWFNLLLPYDWDLSLTLDKQFCWDHKVWEVWFWLTLLFRFSYLWLNFFIYLKKRPLPCLKVIRLSPLDISRLLISTVLYESSWRCVISLEMA